MFGISPMRTGSRGSHEWDVMASLCREDRINAGYPLVLAFQTTTANETITLPAQTSKHFYAMWGDGITEKCTGITEHVYDKPGAYIVRLMGDVDAVSFHETPSANKLINILNWGSIQWKTLKGAFSGCKNLVGTASDEPSLTYCTDISYAFMNASKFVGNVSGWDVRNVSSATGTFLNAKSFNQNLELWDVQNIAAFQNFLKGTRLSSENFERTITKWAKLPRLQRNVVISFGDAELHNEEAIAAKNHIISNYSWLFAN